MKQKYAIGFITFMLATVLAACVHDYPAMTPDGEEGIDPTLVEVSTEVTLDLELLPLEIITNKAHRGITKARAGEQTDYRRRFIIEAWRDGKPAARQVTVMDNADEAGNGKITLPVHLKLYAVEYTLAVWTDYVVAGTTTDLYYNTENLQQEIRAIWILESLSAKDLRDVTLDVLNDHLLTNISDWEKIETDLFKRMYLNPPRIANEMLTPYKKVLREAIEKTVYQSVPDSMKRDPKVLIEWCRKEIKINNELNSQQIPISPMGVWKARVADEKSRDIFFVAAYRSMGWASAAWIDEVTGKVQILNEEFAKEDVNFDTAEAAQSRKGVLQATYTPIRSVEDPKYYSHFTLSKFKNGTFQLLNYDEGETDMGDGTTWRNLLKYGRELDEGYYMMVTGTRLASDAVLSNSTFFTIEPGKTTTVDLVMRESKDQVQVIGNFNSEATYRPVDSTEQRSILQTCGRGYFVVAVLGVGQEPTNHALRDIAALGNDFEQWGRKMVFLFPSEEQYKKFNADEFKGLPSIITYGIDVDDSIRKEIVQAMNLNNSILPVFIIADTFNRVVFVSQGYTIGLGEQLMKVVHGL